MAFGWSVFIMTVCFLPANDLPKHPFFSELQLDKIVHVFLFFVQGFLLFNPISRYKSTPKKSKLHILFVVLYCLLLGFIIEFIQEFSIESRSGDVFDFLADFFGVVLAFTLFKVKKHI